MAWEKGPENTPKFPNVIARHTGMVHVGSIVTGIQARGGRGDCTCFSLSSTNASARPLAGARASAFFLCVWHTVRPTSSAPARARCKRSRHRRAHRRGRERAGRRQITGVRSCYQLVQTAGAAVGARVAHYARQPSRGVREFKEPLSKLLTFCAIPREISIRKIFRENVWWN